MLWYVLRPTIWQSYLKCLKEQVAERGEVPATAWPTERHAAIASKIEDILAESCWGEKLSFLPDDPYCIIGEIEVGDLSEIEAMMDIEDTFGIKFPPDEWKIEKAVTFEDVVGFIERSANP